MSHYSLEELESLFQGKDIVILGNGPSRNKVTSDQESAWRQAGKSIWTFSGGWTNTPSDLGWYMDDLHGPDFKVMKTSIPYEECLAVTGHAYCPVMTSTAYPQYTSLLSYPLEQVVRFFDLDEPYFAESLNYAIAWGLMIGVKSFEFHGVDYINSRPEERASFEYWAGVCKGMRVPTYNSVRSAALRTQPLNGVNIHVPNLYGYLPQNVPIPYEIKSNGITKFQIQPEGAGGEVQWSAYHHHWKWANRPEVQSLS